MNNNSATFSESQFPFSSAEIRLFADLGFAAINAGHVVPALGIFHGLRVLRPEHAFSFIGVALSHMAIGAFDEAIACLTEADRIVSVERDDLRLYLGLAYVLSGNLEASDRILLELSEENRLEDKQRFFLSTILQKRHLLSRPSNWPIPAKICLKQSQLTESGIEEGSDI